MSDLRPDASKAFCNTSIAGSPGRAGSRRRRTGTGTRPAGGAPGSRSRAATIRRRLRRRHRLGRLAELAAVARLDLDEHQRRAVARDDVHFATARPVAPGKNCVPAPLQLAHARSSPIFPRRLPAPASSPAIAQRRLPRPIRDANAQTAELPTSCRAREPRSARVHCVQRRDRRPRSAPRRRSRPRCRPAPASAPAAARTGSQFLPAPSSSSPRWNAAVTTASRSSMARSFVVRSRTSSTPTISPRPRTSPMSGCFVHQRLRARPSGARRRRRRSPSAAPSAA